MELYNEYHPKTVNQLLGTTDDRRGSESIIAESADEDEEDYGHNNEHQKEID